MSSPSPSRTLAKQAPPPPNVTNSKQPSSSPSVTQQQPKRVVVHFEGQTYRMKVFPQTSLESFLDAFWALAGQHSSTAHSKEEGGTLLFFDQQDDAVVFSVDGFPDQLELFAKRRVAPKQSAQTPRTTASRPLHPTSQKKGTSEKKAPPMSQKGGGAPSGSPGSSFHSSSKKQNSCAAFMRPTSSSQRQTKRWKEYEDRDAYQPDLVSARCEFSSPGLVAAIHQRASMVQGACGYSEVVMSEERENLDRRQGCPLSTYSTIKTEYKTKSSAWAKMTGKQRDLPNLRMKDPDEFPEISNRLPLDLYSTFKSEKDKAGSAWAKPAKKPAHWMEVKPYQDEEIEVIRTHRVDGYEARKTYQETMERLCPSALTSRECSRQ